MLAPTYSMNASLHSVDVFQIWRPESVSHEKTQIFFSGGEPVISQSDAMLGVLTQKHSSVAVVQ